MKSNNTVELQNSLPKFYHINNVLPRYIYIFFLEIALDYPKLYPKLYFAP